ncbi:Hsp20/alpha crystallin family protein [Amphiplicatus metriothermophilus]|uniref:HSP20 family protein n=1 Tax=Amphiplicatus metriothermophilus TaxID=1519374 RepID=A0A239PPK2_9PROT|nr:Hsp20/alpha crystallin family protein [Amphiplicatus metriothermophilus]MBB5518618.1 HSP20 family protein [Amphiplicatus metriothermophilus]SNT72224.1 HSP20 family protein [Amphiplicatus metriothermophilus]
MRITDLVPWRRKKSGGALESPGGRALAIRDGGDRDPVLSLHRDLNTAFDRFFDRFERSFFGGAGVGFFSQPRADVAESDDAFRISIDLPGLDEKDIDVTLSGDALTIRGERREEREENEKGYFLHERSYGSFFRSIPLPPGVDPDRAKAEFKKGVLRITLPKSEEAKRHTRRIEVKAA